MLEKRGGGGQGGGDGVQGGNALVCGRREAGEVFEGEEGAEASGERGGFACEGGAEGENGGVRGGWGVVEGHFGCGFSVLQKGKRGWKVVW